MTKRLTVNKFIIYLVMIAFTGGCTTMHSLPATDAQSLANQIVVGDKINIIRNDDTDVTFEVGAFSNEGISGDGAFVAYSDISQVRVSDTNNGTILGLVAGIVLLVALIGSGGGGGSGGGSGY